MSTIAPQGILKITFHFTQKLKSTMWGGWLLFVDTIKYDNPFMFLIEHLFFGQGLRLWKSKCKVFWKNLGHYDCVWWSVCVGGDAIENCWDAIFQEEIQVNDSGKKKCTHEESTQAPEGTNLKYGGWTLAGARHPRMVQQIVFTTGGKEPQWAMGKEGWGLNHPETIIYALY